jgi:hypothetical protein
MAGPRHTRRPPGRILRAVCAAAVAVAVVAGVPSPASAAPALELSIMDDQLLLGASRAKIDRTMETFQALGVDRLRVSAFWSSHAPSAGSTRKPRFDATNPSDPRYDWSRLDPVVASAKEHGLRVMMSISTPAPLWGTASPRRGNPVYRPRADELASFGYAVALRYGAVVDQYGLLNEPNQGAWLQPQSDRRGLVSPHLYRELARSLYIAVKVADPDAVTLAGELAPSGRSDRGPTRPIRPLEFLRAMGCRDRRFRALRSGRCRDFEPVVADDIGHHPYSLFSSPSARSRQRDDVAMGDSRRLLATLDRLRARGAIVSAGDRPFDVYYTEFGYQTDPPDPFAGIPLARQDRWLQEAAYVAWSSPRVRALNQFRLTDGRVGRSRDTDRFLEFQSGLLFSARRPKPAFRSFPHPIVLRRIGGRLRVWGQVRPGGVHAVTIEYRRGSRGRFRRVETDTTDALGFFSERLPPRRGSYRYRYSDGAISGTSSVVRFGRR